MSDKVKGEFKPIDISSLDSFNDERSGKGSESEPDWERFKVFFEELKNEENEQKASDPFKALFEDDEEAEKKEDIVFDQLGTEKQGEADSDAEDSNKEIEPGRAGIQETEGEIDVTKSSDAGDSHPDQMQPDASSVTEEPIQKAEEGKDKSRHDNLQNDKGYETGFKIGKKDGYEKGLEQGNKDGNAQGLEKGYSEGYANGEQEARKDIQDIISQKSEEFEAVLLKLENTYKELAARYEEKIISLICQIAEKVVVAKVEIDDEVAKHSVIEALWALPEPEDITLSVSEEDYEYIEMVKEDLFDSIKSLKTVFVKSDASVKRGGCRIETNKGIVESDIESKLEKIFAIIKGSNKT